MSAPVDKRVDSLDSQCKTIEKSIGNLEKSIAALTKDLDTARHESAKQFENINAQSATVIKALADRLAALEKQKMPSESNLETFKKAFNSFAKQLAAAESHQAEDSKALHNAIAALEK